MLVGTTRIKTERRSLHSLGNAYFQIVGGDGSWFESVGPDGLSVVFHLEPGTHPSDRRGKMWEGDDGRDVEVDVFVEVLSGYAIVCRRG